MAFKTISLCLASGCMKDVRFNNYRIPLDMHGKELVSILSAQSITEGCSSEACRSNPCTQEFICVDLWMTHECRWLGQIHTQTTPDSGGKGRMLKQCAIWRLPLAILTDQLIRSEALSQMPTWASGYSGNTLLLGTALSWCKSVISIDSVTMSTACLNWKHLKNSSKSRMFVNPENEEKRVC